MKRIQSKIAEKMWWHRFPHYKSMWFFSYAQGQLTPQSLVRSGRISNSSEMLWMFSLPASMKKIRSKTKALNCWQHFPHYNPMVAMETSGRIWPNFELNQALIHVLITCKYEKDPIKNDIVFPIISLWDFFIRSRAAFSAVLGPIWPNFELVRDVMDILVTCKYEEDPNKNEGASVLTTFSALYTYGSYPLPWTPEFQSDLAQNLMQPFPHPNEGSDKISLRLAHWLRWYSSLKMFTDMHTHRQTDHSSTGKL